VIGEGHAETAHGSYALSIARVFDETGLVVGAGFLVAADVVATCAHVVLDALGRDPSDGRLPPERVLVDFPFTRESGERSVAARVVQWVPVMPDGSGDVALLRLDVAAPSPARVPPLSGWADLWGYEFRVLGFPVDQADGVWVTGRLREIQGTGWLQMQAVATDHAIDEGYSGAPVWSSELGAVVGMTVARARDRATTTAYLLPTAQVLGLDPELLPCPYRGLEPFEEQHAPLFHGRGNDIDRLVTAAREHPVVAVAGRSGTGKSSLVRAGLLPVLRDEGALVAECQATPGREASTSVADALATALGSEWVPEQVAERLRSPEDRLRLVDALVQALDEHGRLVLVLDQFEEAVATDPAGARELLTLVVQLAGPPSPVRAVLTVRWESLSGLLTPDLAAALEDSTVFLTEMRRHQLREAIIRPAERAPGLDFEPGLVERILDDAGAEPGRLPLVQSLLTQLWTQRDGGRLKVGEYEALGGVSGALIQLAERTIKGLPDPGDMARVRRLLIRLARPVDDGFIRHPTAFDTLERDLQETAIRLAGSRLIVLGSTPDGTDTVELAHQALIEHWPTLRKWLIDDSDFLSWRQRLETQHQHWKGANRDAGTLLRGAALATALDWTRDRADDIPAEARTFIRHSHRRQRRDVRRWRIVAAVLVVLVLVAGTLTVVAVRRGDEIGRQLDAANAEILAQLSAQRSAADPVTATQFALAAYRGDPGNLAAKAALAREYLAMRSADAVFADLAPASINNVTVSDDGRTVAFDTDTVSTVVTGLAGPAPRPEKWELPGIPKNAAVYLSPDGRRLVALAPDNAVLVWDVARRTGPKTLVPGTGEGTAQLVFSPDGKRLARLAGGRLVMVDPDRRTSTDYSITTGEPVTFLRLTDDPDHVVLGHGDPLDRDARTLVVSSLSTGNTVRTLPSGSVVVHGGAAVLACAPGEPMASVSVTATDTGSEIARFPALSFDCPADEELAWASRGRYLVEQAPPSTDVGLVRITDLTTGRSYDTSVPPGGLTDGNLPPRRLTAGVFTGADGPAMFVARGTSLLRIGRMAPELKASPNGVSSSLTPDGRYVVTRTTFGGPNPKLTVYARQSGTRLGEMPLPADASLYGLGIGESLGLITSPKSSLVLTLYTLPELRRKGQYTLPSRAELRSIPQVVTKEDSGRFVAVAAGTAAVWDSDTQELIGDPLRVGTSSAIARFRPGHRWQAVVGDSDGSVRLWDLAARSVVATIPVRLGSRGGSLAFDASGDRLAVVTSNRTVRIWDLSSGRLVGPTMPVGDPVGTDVLGFSADGSLLISNSFGKLSFVDLTSGRASGTLNLPRTIFADALLGNGARVGDTSIDPMMPMHVPVTAAAWFGELCQFADRMFTDSELAILPPGADRNRPCA
jgi:WD40 repeat protein